MNEDELTEGGRTKTTNNSFPIFVGLGLLLVVAVVIYWQFGQPKTVSVPNNGEVTQEDKAKDTIADLPPTVVVEEEVKTTEIVEDFGMAEVTTTFVSPRSVADAVVYYREGIVAKGGKIDTSMRTPEKEIIVATTADGKPYVVYIGEKDGETIVTINVDPVQ